MAFCVQTVGKRDHFRVLVAAVLAEVVPRARAEVREAQRQENRLANRESRKDLLEVLRVTLIFNLKHSRFSQPFFAAVFWLSVLLSLRLSRAYLGKTIRVKIEKKDERRKREVKRRKTAGVFGSLTSSMRLNRASLRSFVRRSSLRIRKNFVLSAGLLLSFAMIPSDCM